MNTRNRSTSGNIASVTIVSNTANTNNDTPDTSKQNDNNSDMSMSKETKDNSLNKTDNDSENSTTVSVEIERKQRMKDIFRELNDTISGFFFLVGTLHKEEILTRQDLNDRYYRHYDKNTRLGPVYIKKI